jgi:hypothetical protein
MVKSSNNWTQSRLNQGKCFLGVEMTGPFNKRVLVSQDIILSDCHSKLLLTKKVCPRKLDLKH